MAEWSEGDMEDLSAVLKGLLQKYDGSSPSRSYMMVVHQAPTDGEDHRYAHLRFEFLHTHRAANRLKFLAGVESGAAPSSTTSSPRRVPRAAAGRAGERRGGAGGGKAGGVTRSGPMADALEPGSAPAGRW